jgi:tRNA1(Val) A37 N6-methylase TrmN6
MGDISEDRLLDGKLLLRQPEQGYRAAIDPVLMAAAVSAADGEMILDLGSGVGAASLCLAARVAGCRIFGLEMQPALVALARQNIEINGFTGRIESMIGTLQTPPPRLAPGSFHHVMTNPPYNDKQGTPSGDAGKDAANREGEVDLAAWMRFAINMLRPKGSLTVIYRADRLDDLLAAFNKKVGEILIIPLWPKHGRAAKRILVKARKGIASPMTLSAGLVLHEEDGRYTQLADDVLRRGAAISST